MHPRARSLFRLLLFVAAAAGLGTLADVPRTASADPRGAEPCHDPLAHAPGALFCVHHHDGYALFQSSATTPNTIYETHSTTGMDVIVFENWVVIVTDSGREVVPRDRLVYTANEEFK